MRFTVPPPLTEGDRVAVVQPAAVAGGGEYPDHLVDLGFERLRAFGLDPVAYDSLGRSGASLYDHPEERARELERAFRDPEISGVVAAIGGNDQIRVLKHLDPEPFRDNPTRFFGTSDNTSVQAFLREAAGVVSFYGGTLFTDVAEPGRLNDYTREYLRRAFFEDALGEVREAEQFSDHDPDWTEQENLESPPEYEESDGRRWFGPERRVEGRTWGGCLEVLSTHFLADRCLPDDPEGTVLLLETSEELPAAGEVRRVLTGMGERGYLDVGAVLVGRAKARSHRDQRSPEERAAYRERQREAVVDVVGEYGDAVVVTDVEFGHCRPVAPLPVGGRTVVDSEAHTVTCPGP